jgi:phosphate starvation-inducible PhoH-like protein
LSKRKTGALRKADAKMTNIRKHTDQTFYTNESKTIQFDTLRPKKTSVIQLVPKSINQEKYILELLDPNTHIVIGTGPAGTGKTYLAMLAAIKALKTQQVDKILLTRPDFYRGILTLKWNLGLDHYLMYYVNFTRLRK